MARDSRDRNKESGRGEFIDKVVKIKRCAAVVKGGRRFSFAAMVVVGDGKGRVGWGYGKANEVPPSVEKAQKQASRRLINIPIDKGTIPHTIEGHYGAAHVILMPAGRGTVAITTDYAIGYTRHVGLVLELRSMDGAYVRSVPLPEIANAPGVRLLWRHASRLSRGGSARFGAPRRPGVRHKAAEV